jgi:uncharacterized damage-inducible protein DinB
MPLSPLKLLLGEFDVEAANTRKMLERFPSEKTDWKPHDKSFSMSALAGHVATLPNFATEIAGSDRMDMKPGDHKPFLPKTKAELVERFEAESKKAREALAKMPEADLEKNWAFYYDGTKYIDQPKFEVLRSFYFNHLVHHRGQLTVYYRENGVPVPGLYGPSADES